MPYQPINPFSIYSRIKRLFLTIIRWIEASEWHMLTAIGIGMFLITLVDTYIAYRLHLK